MSRYGDKLGDPRWQARRWEIMERDGFLCQHCERFGMWPLQVHHRWYDGEPWEAPDAALVTLCVPCHEDETERMRLEHVARLRAKRARANRAADDVSRIVWEEVVT